MERAASAVLVLAFVACGGQSVSSIPTSTSTIAPTASATASASAAASSVAPAPAPGSWTFNIDGSSRTTVRVREVLATVRAPGDAVLTVSGMKGAFTLHADGAFAPTSKITADLTTIDSDSNQRDSFVRDNTLQTRRFPTAEFVPTRATGLALPLPASGELRFALEGKMTLRGTTKDVTFNVIARRDGKRLTATAVAAPAYKFRDFNMEIPRVASVLSIEDDIRVEISLVATEVA